MTNVNIILSEPAIEYLEKCARIRHISRARLMERVLKTVCEDQMVLSVLDDDSRPERQREDEPTRSRFHKNYAPRR